jgi:hypothetical protein
VTAVEAARAAYAVRAAAAPRTSCYRLIRYGCCRSCGPKVLAVEAASVALDCAQAMQFAEFRPDPRLTTPPKVTP